MRKTAILLALACAFARADYGPGTTDSDLLRSGTPVVTNAWLAVSNKTVMIARSVAGDAGAITDGTNRIDATRDVWRMFSGRVCTNANEVWTYSVDGVTYTEEQMVDAIGGGESEYSQTLVWMNSTFMGKDGEEEFEGWFVIDGTGTHPIGYSYTTGDIPESSADHFLALAEYVGYDYSGYRDVTIRAFRGTEVSGTNYVGRLALTNDIPTVTSPDFTTNNAQLVATIEAKAPAPGNYGTVSNRAMTAIQEQQLGAFAATGSVARAAAYGTPTRWTDSTGCVWEVANYWTLHNGDDEVRLTYGTKEDSIWAFGYPEETVAGRTGTMHYHLEIYDGVAELSVGEYYGDFIDDYYIYPDGNSIDVTVGYDGGNYVDFSGQIDDTYAVWGMTNLIGRVALTNDIPDVSGYATQQQATNAATAVADTKISTNNAAFVEAVTNCPVVIASGGGADWPIGDFGQYGTIGAIIAALVAASTWLKSHLRYELHDVVLTGGAGTLLDRAGNRVVVSGDTTLTLPALVDAGKARDFLVRLEISGSTVPTITFAAPTGETIVYETDGDEFPVPDEAGDWLYSFTESCVAHTFAVALKKVNEVAQGGA